MALSSEPEVAGSWFLGGLRPGSLLAEAHQRHLFDGLNEGGPTESSHSTKCELHGGLRTVGDGAMVSGILQ